jgi:antitoxin (DNA-binding transcriptional repressor) of toxin-antitoxin stability system
MLDGGYRTELSLVHGTIKYFRRRPNSPRLVEDAALGEKIVIAKAGEPIARLVPLAATERRVPKLGTLPGQIEMADDWDGPETNGAIWAEFWENLENESWDYCSILMSPCGSPVAASALIPRPMQFLAIR